MKGVKLHVRWKWVLIIFYAFQMCFLVALGERILW